MEQTEERTDNQQRALRDLFIKAFAALSPESREKVLVGGDDDDAERDAQRDVA